MSLEMRFVKTVRDNMVFGRRCYPIGSVVLVPEPSAHELVKAGHAEHSAGPAFEPGQDPTPTPSTNPARLETAVARSAPEKSVARR